MGGEFTCPQNGSQNGFDNHSQLSSNQEHAVDDGGVRQAGLARPGVGPQDQAVQQVSHARRQADGALEAPKQGERQQLQQAQVPFEARWDTSGFEWKGERSQVAHLPHIKDQI